jgi:hypothetical protein
MGTFVARQAVSARFNGASVVSGEPVTAGGRASHIGAGETESQRHLTSNFDSTLPVMPLKAWMEGEGRKLRTFILSDKNN